MATGARVLVVGVGGLGCPALYVLGPALGRAGGTLTLADPDRVDVTNLHRQVLFTVDDVGRDKVKAARLWLAARAPGLPVRALPQRIDAANVTALVGQHDLVLDGTDSFEAKFLLNDACVAAGVPLVHGAVVGWGGQLMSVVPGHACYRCLFEEPPGPDVEGARCQDQGVIGPVAGVVGALMAAEALALLGLVDRRPRLAGALERYDGKTDARRTVRLNPRPGCPACAQAPSPPRSPRLEERRTA